MGYRKVPTIYHLSFADPDYEGLEITMKSIKMFGQLSVSFSAVRKITTE